MNTMGRMLVSGVLLALGAGCAGSDSPAQSDDDLTARPTLRIPILIERTDGSDSKPEGVTKINAQLSKLGLPALPATVTIKSAKEYGVQRDKIAKIVDDAVNKGLQIQLAPAYEPYTLETKDPATTICWSGNPLKIAGLITDLTDGLFSEQLTLGGWRYKKVKELDESWVDSEDQMPKIWKEWRGDGEAILTVTDSSDSGDSMSAGLIVKCK